LLRYYAFVEGNGNSAGDGSFDRIGKVWEEGCEKLAFGPRDFRDVLVIMWIWFVLYRSYSL
jgi:hypothetical protein